MDRKLILSRRGTVRTGSGTRGEQKHRSPFVSGYLESFEESRAQEQEKMSRSRENVVSLLEHCSRVRRGRRRRRGGRRCRKEGRSVTLWVACAQNLVRLRHVGTATASELRDMQEVLVSKETEVVQSESTARGLRTGQ